MQTTTDHERAGDSPPSWIDAGFVGVMALLLLVLSEPSYLTEHIYMQPYLNDQVGYITTARWLADTGELRSHLIYSAYAGDPDWRVYMPGHYYALASVFWLFGYTPLLARIPCLASYVLCAVGIFLIGRRLYGRGAGFTAAALFMIFPPIGYFAFSALADLTVTAAVVASFAIFVHLPERVRFWSVPLLLIPPFLFRETTALVVIPMSLMVLYGPEGRRWIRFLVASLGSVASLSLINQWQLSLGKVPTPLSWVSHGSFNYADAARELEPTPSAAQWITGLQSNLGTNLSTLSTRYSEGLTNSIEPLSTAAIASGVIALIVWGVRRWRTDLFPLGAALLTSALVFVVVFAYSVYGFRLMRTLLFTVPLLTIGLGGLASAIVGSLLRRRSISRPPGFALPIFVALALVAGYPAMMLSANAIQKNDPAKLVALIETIGHADDTVLISDPWIGFPYVLEHYPVRWAFRPENEETLRLICEHHPVGTYIPANRDMLLNLPPREIRAFGFVRDPRPLKLRDTRFPIFKTETFPPRAKPCGRQAPGAQS
jgi:4-amino-4-deoxy-L-arabinose transferase-like glycosyltransferase